MAASLIAFTGLIYLWTCIDLAFAGKYGLSLAYFGYSLSNVGLYFVAKG